jgi:hypothetical protein
VTNFCLAYVNSNASREYLPLIPTSAEKSSEPKTTPCNENKLDAVVRMERKSTKLLALSQYTTRLYGRFD